VTALQAAAARLDATPELAFAVEGAEVLRFAAAPTLSFRVRIDCLGGGEIRSLMLATQVRIAVTRRSYDERAQARLVELFGDPSRWGETLRSLLWTHSTLLVPPFRDGTVVEMPLSCTYDLDVAATKYFHALEDGDVPLEFLFSGTVFYAGAGGLQTGRVPWDREAEFRLPVRLWREMMDEYFPDSGWVRLRTDSFERLRAYRARNALTSWDQAVEWLLDADEASRGG
jgi:hypothetical protein